MPLVVPNEQEVEILTNRLTPPLTLKLYANDVTPSETSTAVSFTEISGGGYSSEPLLFAEWTITPGEPSVAVYNTILTWIFTGPVDGLGNIFGYFVIRDNDGKLMWAERFPVGFAPFEPIAGSKLQILARYSAQSQF